MLGEDGPPASPLKSGLLDVAIGFLERHVAVEMAVANEIGMRHNPFPWRYCMAVPMSSSISLATWCSVTVMVSLLSDDDAVCIPLLLLPCTKKVAYLKILEHSYEFLKVKTHVKYQFDQEGKVEKKEEKKEFWFGKRSGKWARVILYCFVVYG